MKRTIAFILSICMIITCFSGIVIAEEANITLPSNTNSSEKNNEDNEVQDKSDTSEYPEFTPEPVIKDGMK